MLHVPPIARKGLLHKLRGLVEFVDRAALGTFLEPQPPQQKIGRGPDVLEQRMATSDLVVLQVDRPVKPVARKGLATAPQAGRLVLELLDLVHQGPRLTLVGNAQRTLRQTPQKALRQLMPLEQRGVLR
jgi:hypothetical protein